MVLHKDMRKQRKGDKSEVGQGFGSEEETGWDPSSVWIERG